MIASRWQDALQLTGDLKTCCAWSCDDTLGSLADTMMQTSHYVV